MNELNQCLRNIVDYMFNYDWMHFDYNQLKQFTIREMAAAPF